MRMSITLLCVDWCLIANLTGCDMPMICRPRRNPSRLSCLFLTPTSEFMPQPSTWDWCGSQCLWVASMPGDERDLSPHS